MLTTQGVTLEPGSSAVWSLQAS